MIIIKDKPGQLCNRLWAFTPFINEAIENNVNLVVLYFYEYYQYFENLEIFNNVNFIKNKHKALIYKLLISILKLVSKNILSSIGILYHTKSSQNLLNQKSKLVIISGWHQQKPDKALRLADIQQLFRPKAIYTRRVDEILKQEKNNSDLIIGVHIRRGDYIEYRNGIYYYSDSDIINYLIQLQKEFGSNKKTTFLLCSNEKINTNAYINRQIPVFQIPDANLIEDLYALSKCNYIIGPPSTFSMWASFYGQTPLCFVKQKNMILRKDDFSVVTSQNRFKNGKVFTH